MDVSQDQRVGREIASYRPGGHRDARARHARLFQALYTCPAARAQDAAYEARLRPALGGRRVLEIGCGTGWNAQRMRALGAASVEGIDISPDMLDEAQERANEALSFRLHDCHEPMTGQYDVILGRAILHHLNWRLVLPRLYEENLAPGGLMLFMEPLGSSLLMKLYWRFGQRFHTDDERPFFRADLAWLRSRFSRIEITPFQYLSLPVAAAGALVGLPSDNALNRGAHAVDEKLLRRLPGLAHRCRSAIFEIRKPPA
jgi:SAM-dependent methyltransferase